LFPIAQLRLSGSHHHDRPLSSQGWNILSCLLCPSSK